MREAAMPATDPDRERHRQLGGRVDLAEHHIGDSVARLYPREELRDPYELELPPPNLPPNFFDRPAWLVSVRFADVAQEVTVAPVAAPVVFG
jgi:hypothetical protein